ncbi:hypothetical protein [Frankia sp. AgKG'84/4]|uniref:hypothetical protein n=1 Tax=Frankia sp. AgKG'84/4 TaxID=573490 RepID=UPI00200EEF1E|nr:hypothetical protein [Frankia sp. AgKG'84/4]MCL9793875.1 hypothetical protein [Frankia sp. AgKG'84/4]
MTTFDRRRVRAVWVASLLLLIGLVGGPPGTNGTAPAHPGDRALPVAVAIAVPIGATEATAVRIDGRGVAAASLLPGQPGGYALAVGLAALVLGQLIWWRRVERGSGQPCGQVTGCAARAPPPSRTPG